MTARIVFRAGWPSKVDHGKSAGKFFRNRPWRRTGWLWIGPYVVGNLRKWDAS